MIANPPLIGLTGPARSGKDTIARHLVMTYAFAQYAFADPLRDALMALFNLSPRDFEGDKKELAIDWLGKSPRELLQTLGTEWGRERVHPDMLQLVAAQNLRFLQEVVTTAIGFVISDVRFENEAKFIRERGGIILHVHRPDALEVNPHSSEDGIAMHALDRVIVNCGDIQDLELMVDTVLNLKKEAAA